MRAKVQELRRCVSRETTDKLSTYADLVRKWNPHINLVSKNSLHELESRHIADSIQIYALAPKSDHWLDIGSGGGFPGLVCAVIAASENPETQFTLVEADTRKATFLRTVIRELGLCAKVEAKRIEMLAPQNADVLSARALSDLGTLLKFTKLHLRKEGTGLFPKGKSWEKEVAEARTQWSFSLERHKSETDPDAVILQIGDVTRV